MLLLSHLVLLQHPASIVPQLLSNRKYSPGKSFGQIQDHSRVGSPQRLFKHIQCYTPWAPHNRIAYIQLYWYQEQFIKSLLILRAGTDSGQYAKPGFYLFLSLTVFE